MALDTATTSPANEASPPGWLASNGQAPNNSPIEAPCPSSTYFPPFPENFTSTEDSTADPVGFTTSVGSNPADPSSVRFHMETTAVNNDATPLFKSTSRSQGYDMGQGDTVEVWFDQPLFYPRFMFVDVDRRDEGFQITPLGGPMTMGIYSGQSELETSGTSSQVNFVSPPNIALEGWEFDSRVQVDLFGAVDANERIRFHRPTDTTGSSGFSAGGGCLPVGLAKHSSTPIWNQAGQYFEVAHTVRLANNLPGQQRLDQYANQVMGPNCSASATDNDPCLITGAVSPITIQNLSLVDPIATQGFSEVVVTGLTEVADADGLNLGASLNAAYGPDDPNLLSAGSALGASQIATIEFDVRYYPDFSAGCGPRALSTQATVTGSADGIALQDLSDSGVDPAPAATNGAGGANDATAVNFPAIACEVAVSKAPIASSPTILGDGSVPVAFGIDLGLAGSSADMFVNASDNPADMFGAGVSVSDVSLTSTGPCATSLNPSWGVGSTNLFNGPVLLEVGGPSSCAVTLSYSALPSGGAVASTTYSGSVQAVANPVNYRDANGDGIAETAVASTTTFTDSDSASITPGAGSVAIGLTKDLTESVGLFDGNVVGQTQVTYSFLIENLGEADLTNVLLTDDFSAAFPGLAVSGPVYDDIAGDCSSAVAAGTATIAAGSSCTAVWQVTVIGLASGSTYRNTATVTADSIFGPATDISDDDTTNNGQLDSSDRDGDGNANENGENDPTPLVMPVLEPGIIINQVWDDVDGDGIQDASEPGIIGVPVNLYRVDPATNDRVLLETRVTGGGGSCPAGESPCFGLSVFRDVSSGPNWVYVVSVEPPEGQMLTQAEATANDELDSDIDRATGLSEPFVLESGAKNRLVDAGLVPDDGSGAGGDDTWLLGDVNCSNDVNIVDALIIAVGSVGNRVAADSCAAYNSAPSSRAVMYRGDVNLDNVTNVLDSLHIARCSVGSGLVECGVAYKDCPTGICRND